MQAMEAGQAPGEEESLGILRKNLEHLEARITAACGRSSRPRDSVALLPVVKYVGPGTLRLLHRVGVRDAGEGTVQGALEKAGALTDLRDLRMHLVGHLQRNKTKKAMRLFTSIHSLDSLRLAGKMEEELRLLEADEEGVRCVLLPGLPRLYIEVNIAGEASKGGVPPTEAPAFLDALRALPRVTARIAGLMAMAPESDDPEGARAHFRALRELRDRLCDGGRLPPGAGLSMGMSSDFPVAVEEGATVVRVGSRIFQDLPGFEGPPGPGAPPCR